MYGPSMVINRDERSDRIKTIIKYFKEMRGGWDWALLHCQQLHKKKLIDIHEIIDNRVHSETYIFRFLGGEFSTYGLKVVSCPTRWSLLLAVGFLYWSSSWWWQPHIAGCKLFRPLLRAGISVFDHFFCKMYFLYVSGSCKKNLADFFWVLPPQKSTFLWTGWLAGQISGIEGMPSILENCIIKI